MLEPGIMNKFGVKDVGDNKRSLLHTCRYTCIKETNTLSIIFYK